MSTIDRVSDAVIDLATAARWEWRIAGAAETTCSLYLELSREWYDEEDEERLEILDVRISDHAAVAGRGSNLGERFAIRLDRQPDADLDRLRERLAQPPRDNT